MSGIKRPTTPKDLVDLRTWMIEQYRPGGVLRFLARERDETLNLSGLESDISSDQEVHTLRECELWWIDQDMCDLIDAAVQSLPEHVELTFDLPRAPAAICVFARPLFTTFADDDDKQPIDLVRWTQCRSPIDQSFFVASRVYVWGPGCAGLKDTPFICGTTNWGVGDCITKRYSSSFDEPAHQSIVDIHRLLVTIWLLASQPGLAESRTERPDRHTARRAKRAGIDNSDVRIVSIRKALHDEPTEHRQGSSPSVRFLVSGHWRNQPYGPGLVKRRPKWIAPYVKGPDDAPLRIRETVKVLR